MDEYNSLPEDLKQERRIANHQVEVERRRINDMNARVAVLEIKVSTAESRIEDTHATQVRIIDKLDAHVAASTERDHQLQNTINQITGAVTTLSSTVSETNSTLKEIANLANTSAKQILKWDAIAMTLIKVATVIAMVTGAAWTVFTWLESKAHEKVAIQDISSHIANEISLEK